VLFFKKIQDWILKSERIRKRILSFFIKQINQDLSDLGASKELKNPFAEWILQSKIVTQQLKSSIHRFYGCFCLKSIFQSTGRIKSFKFPLIRLDAVVPFVEGCVQGWLLGLVMPLHWKNKASAA